MTTGIPGLDEILNGGVIRGHSYLLVGSAGTGKTIFSLQWLREGVRLGEKTLYITLSESRENIAGNIASFDWTLDGIEILDLSPAQAELSENIEEYQVFSPDEIEHSTVWEKIYQTIKEIKPHRLVIDAATNLHYLSQDEYQYRNHILSFTTFLNTLKITSLLLFDSPEVKRETAISLAADAIIELRMEISAGLMLGLRSLQISKLRGSDFLSGYHPLKFDEHGIHLYPHQIEMAGTAAISHKKISSGIAQLDELLGGGLDAGTTTILSGPTGIGKTSLGIHFLKTEAIEGSKGILFTFEESVNSVINRSCGINLDIQSLIKKDMIKIVRMNSMETYPDEFLARIRTAVEKDNYKLVMIDSLRGYQLAMSEFGSLLTHIHNLVTYLNRQGVSVLLIDEVEALTGHMKVTEMGLSHLADNILLLRYMEHNGKIIKIIGCLKKRLSGFQTELREMNITSKGISVDEKSALHSRILTDNNTFAL